MTYITGLEICKTDIVYQDVSALVYLNQSNSSNINVLFSNDVNLQNQINQLNYNISNIDSNGLVSNLNSLSNLIHQVDIHTSNLDLDIINLNIGVSNNSTDISQLFVGYSNNSNNISYISAYSSNFLTANSTNVVINKTLDYNSNIFLNFPTNGTGTGSNITSILNISNPYKFKASTDTNQVLTANTWTTIQANVEEYDTGNSYNTTTYQYTILKSGYYCSDYSVVFLDSSVINNENYQARLLINGTNQSSRALQTSIKANNELVIAKANNEYLNVGDTVELQAWSSVGSTVRGYVGTHFNMHMLSINTPLEQMKLYTIVNDSNQIQGNVPYWDGYSNQLNTTGYYYLSDIGNLNTGISNNTNLIGQIDLSLSNQILKESADISSLNQGYSNNNTLIINQINKEASDVLSLNQGYSNNSNNIAYLSSYSSNFITPTQTVALTNKTIDYNLNTLLNLPQLGGGTNYYLNDQPIGAVIDYASSNAPTDWLNCDGSAISRTTYAQLFAIIGTTFGSGDGFSTFNLPDYRDKVSAGIGSKFTIGNNIGTSNLFSSNVYSEETIVMTTSSNGYGIVNSNYQPTIGMNKIIKYTTTNNSFSNVYTGSNLYYLNDSPVGSIIDFAGSNAPTSWLFCYGGEVSRTTYSSLFAVIGTAYGAGDGTTTFNLPDFTGRVSAGLGDNFSLGTKLGTSNLFNSNIPNTPLTLTTTIDQGYSIINSNYQPTIGMNKIIKYEPANNTFTTSTSNIYQVGTNIQNVYNPVWGRIFQNASQCNLTSGVWYDLQLNTFEYQGACNCFDTSTYTLTVPLTGVYRFSYGVEFQGGAVNDDLFVRLLKNGGESEISKQQSIIKAGVIQELTLTDILELQSGDTIKMQAKVDSATNTIDVLGNTYENAGYDLTHLSFVLEATSSNLNPANQLYLSRDFTLTEQTASNIPAFRGFSNEMINTNLYVATSNVGIGTSPFYALDINDTSAIRLPRGTEAQRPSNASGLLRYNTTSNIFEGCTAESNWGQIGGGPATDLKSATTTINISSATAPSSNQVLTAISGTSAIWSLPIVYMIQSSTYNVNNISNSNIFRSYLASDQLDLVNNTYTQITLNTKNYDYNSNFNTTNYRYYAPKDGWYKIDANVTFTNVISGSAYYSSIYNGSSYISTNTNYAGVAEDLSCPINDIIYMNSNNYIELHAKSVSGGNTVDVKGGTAQTFLSGHLLNALTASNIDPTITNNTIDFNMNNVNNNYILRAYLSSDTSPYIGDTLINFNTENFDLNNNFSGGVYTVPISGYYNIATTVLYNCSSPTYAFLNIYVNGSLYYQTLDYYVASSTNKTKKDNFIASLNQNDTVSVKLNFGDANGIVKGGSDSTFLTIHLIAPTTYTKAITTHANITNFTNSYLAGISMSADLNNIITGTWTKVTIDTRVFDISSNFASNKFTCSKAGFYYVNAFMMLNQVSTANKRSGIAIYVNGVIYSNNFEHKIPASGSFGLTISDHLLLNVGDYVELYAITYYGSNVVDILSSLYSGTRFFIYFIAPTTTTYQTVVSGYPYLFT